MHVMMDLFSKHLAGGKTPAPPAHVLEDELNRLTIYNLYCRDPRYKQVTLSPMSTLWEAAQCLFVHNLDWVALVEGTSILSVITAQGIVNYLSCTVNSHFLLELLFPDALLLLDHWSSV